MFCFALLSFCLFIRFRFPFSPVFLEKKSCCLPQRIARLWHAFCHKSICLLFIYKTKNYFFRLVCARVSLQNITQFRWHMQMAEDSDVQSDNRSLSHIHTRTLTLPVEWKTAAHYDHWTEKHESDFRNRAFSESVSTCFFLPFFQIAQLFSRLEEFASGNLCIWSAPTNWICYAEQRGE